MENKLIATVMLLMLCTSFLPIMLKAASGSGPLGGIGHDVAVIDVVPSRNWIYQGHSLNINVTVLNKGDSDENVTVTLYYNITANKIIGTQNVTLSQGQSKTIAFVWGTTGVPYCHNYTITANATIAADNYPADNTLADGTIKVRILGDINDDGKVDMWDLRAMGLAFGSYPGDPMWNPDADLNQSGGIDVFDFRLAAMNFWKGCSP
jgi:hypothetical protein